MQPNYLVSYIQQIPLFANLNADQLELVSQAFEVRSYNANEDIYQQGTHAEGMLTFISGQAVMLQHDTFGNLQPVATIIAGQTINQDALFSDLIQPATLRVQRPAQALKLTRQKFVTLLAHHPELKVPLGMSQKDTSHHAHEVKFNGQRENEEVLVYTPRHWWAFARLAWLPFLIMIAMWFIAILVGQSFISTMLFIASILIPGLFAFYLYLEWRNDAVIVTNQRVIRIWKTILTFSNKVSEVSIQSVHEVNAEVPSNDPFARLFNYGTIEIKTAGDAGNLQLELIPDPESFQQVIIDDRANYERSQAQQHQNAVRAELDRWLEGSTPERIDHPQGATNNTVAAAPPKPKQGGFSYLRTRIEMTNGDIIYRKHVYFWFKHTIVPIMIMVGSFIIFLFSLFSHIEIVGFPFAIVMLLIGFVAYYWQDWDWRNDYYVVSDNTITLIHKRPFFLQSLRDQILMERVDNVVSESSGLFASIFQFGDVRVSLVGADEHKMFKNVPNPQQIQQDISRRQQRVKQQGSEAEARQQREIIGEYLNVFNERLRDQGMVTQPANNRPQPQPETYQIDGQYANTYQGAVSTPDNTTIPGRPAQPSVPFRAVSNPDRNRPPGIPRKGSSDSPQKPSMTPGVPYKPQPSVRNRPARFPTKKDDNTP